MQKNGQTIASFVSSDKLSIDTSSPAMKKLRSSVSSDPQSPLTSFTMEWTTKLKKTSPFKVTKSPSKLAWEDGASTKNHTFENPISTHSGSNSRRRSFNSLDALQKMAVLSLGSPDSTTTTSKTSSSKPSSAFGVHRFGVGKKRHTFHKYPKNVHKTMVQICKVFFVCFLF